MGASAVGNSVLSLVFWGFAFLRMGTTSQAAQMFGRNLPAALTTLLVQAMALSLFISFVLIALQPIITSSALYFISPSNEVKDLANSYIAIRFLSTPAFLMNLSLIGWCIGQQNTTIPMKVIISVNLLNIIFDVIFINQLGWQSDGAAWATVCAEWLGLLINLLFVYLRFGSTLKAHWPKKNKIWINIKPLLTVNADLFLRTLCLLICFAFFTAQGAQINDATLAANMLLFNIVLLTSYALDGFANAAEALIGEAIGSKNKTLFTQTSKQTLLFGITISIGISIFLFVFTVPIVKLLTTIESVQQISLTYYFWIILISITSGFAYIFDGIFIGAAKTKIMRNTVFISTFALFFPVWFIFQGQGNHGLWFALFILNFSRGLMLVFVFYWQQIKKPWIND